jgi:putative membrane protein
VSSVRPPVSPARVLSAVALTAWAGVFCWLLLTGKTALYLSSRTAWVVPLGATVLAAAAIGRVASLRSRRPEPVTARSAAAMALVLVPVVAVLSLPSASLGSFAAARRSGLAGAAGLGSSTEEIARGEIGLFDVAGALRTRSAMRALVGRAGTEVDFVGFVARPSGMPADEFMLTRFLVSCCVADALSVQTRVVGVPPGRLEPDDWVRVRGKIYPLGREVIVDASRVVRVARPARPYLSG